MKTIRETDDESQYLDTTRQLMEDRINRDIANHSRDSVAVRETIADIEEKIHNYRDGHVDEEKM